MTQKRCDDCKYYRASDDYCYYRGYGSKRECKSFERKWEYMTENKRFVLTDFDTELEMLELLNTQAEVISDLSEQNEELKIKFHNCNNSYWKLHDGNHKLKQQLFETSKELLWATSDEVDRALHYEDEVEELRKEIFE